MADLDRCLNVWDLRAAAQRRLPKGVFEFVDRATEDHIAVANNRSAFERIKLRHRALVDVSGRSVATTLFGKPASLPMAIAPTGAAGLCWHEGELELAQSGGEGADSADAVHRVDDADGEDRRGRRAAVVPALCLEAPRPVASADRARQPQRLRGADRHGRFPRLAPTANTTRTTASACRSIRRCASPST